MIDNENYHEETFEPVEGAQVEESVQPEDIQESETQEPKLEESSKELETDKPKEESFDKAKHYQSIADKRLAELEREKVRAEQLERELNQYKSPKAEQPVIPAKPDPLPPMPENFNMVDVATDDDSPSAKWYKAKQKYDIQKDVYDSYRWEQYERGMSEIKQKENVAKEKAYALSEFQKLGATPEKAQQVFDWMSQPGSLTFERALKLFELESNPKAKTPVKKEDKPIYPAPLGAATGENEKAKTPDDEFNEQLGQENRYSLL